MQIQATDGVMLVWRIRFQMDDGRMITHFVATDAGGLVIETPALKVHEPAWIGQSWLALLYVLQQTKKELTCQMLPQGKEEQHVDEPGQQAA